MRICIIGNDGITLWGGAPMPVSEGGIAVASAVDPRPRSARLLLPTAALVLGFKLVSPN
jgi:hypothetical protein